MKKKVIYPIKQNVILRNKFNNETIQGSIINEEEIEGKPFWVMSVPNRPSRLMLAKDAWALNKGKM